MTSDVSDFKKFFKIRGGRFSKKNALRLVPRAGSYAQAQHPD